MEMARCSSPNPLCPSSPGQSTIQWHAIVPPRTIPPTFSSRRGEDQKCHPTSFLSIPMPCNDQHVPSSPSRPNHRNRNDSANNPNSFRPALTRQRLCPSRSTRARTIPSVPLGPIEARSTLARYIPSFARVAPSSTPPYPPTPRNADEVWQMDIQTRSWKCQVDRTNSCSNIVASHSLAVWGLARPNSSFVLAEACCIAHSKFVYPIPIA
mmetsp:Transcript_39662/g.67601  ORF Transcript_39662/g.67601 Transcript_39662/m.67601 type:complete len:210 (+) Transcript_39662:670-1299(+)